MKRPTIEDFVEAKFAAEIHSAIIEDPKTKAIMSKMAHYINTQKRPIIRTGVDANVNRDEVEKYDNTISSYEGLVEYRAKEIKKIIVGNKLNSEPNIRMEYLEYMNEHYPRTLSGHSNQRNYTDRLSVISVPH